jgi:hypothetical protein
LVADRSIRRRRFPLGASGKIQGSEQLGPSIMIACPGFAKSLFEFGEDTAFSLYQLDLDFTKATDSPPVL